MYRIAFWSLQGGIVIIAGTCTYACAGVVITIHTHTRAYFSTPSLASFLDILLDWVVMDYRSKHFCDSSGYFFSGSLGALWAGSSLFLSRQVKGEKGREGT
jgi:hypothetical protein